MAMFRWPLLPRQPFVPLALAAVTAVAVADRWEVAPWVALVIAAAALVPVLVWRRTVACAGFVAAVFFALHTVRHHGSEARALAQRFVDGPRVARITGVVASEPEVAAQASSRGPAARFELQLESVALGGAPQPASARVLVRWSGAPPAYGDRVALTGTAATLAPPRNPGEFDGAEYLRRKGVYCEVRARFSEDCRVLAHRCGNQVQAFAFRARKWLQERLARDLDDAPQIASLIQSMVLGERGETPQEMKELFQRTGTFHLFAISGLNIAMLAGLAWFLLKPLHVGRRAAVFLIIPILVAYALVTGLSPSCVRATVMGTLVLAAHLFDRPPVVFNSLAASALAILAWDTNQLFSPGFQFSFVLVFTIVAFAGRIQRPVERLGEPDRFLPRLLWSGPLRLRAKAVSLFATALAVSVASWLGSMLFTAGYFHLFSLATVFANLIAVPLAFAVLALGVLAVITSVVAPPVAILFNNANWAFAQALLRTVEVFAAVPGGHIYLESPRLRAAPDCEITVLDAGTGGAIHLRADGRDWLLDCAHGFAYERVVLPYLRGRGVDWLDGFALTHGDAGHVGGGVALLGDFAPRIVADSALKDRAPSRRALHAALALRGEGKCILQRGDALHVSPAATLRVLFPPPGWQRSLADDKALVLRLEYAGLRVLFMSDSGFATESWLVAHEPDLRADVVVKGQHARDVSGTLDFLLKVQPRAVVCAVAEFGATGTDLDAWTAALQRRGIEVFRQDRTGAVRLEWRRSGGELRLRSYLGDQTFRSRTR